MQKTLSEDKFSRKYNYWFSIENCVFIIFFVGKINDDSNMVEIYEKFLKLLSKVGESRQYGPYAGLVAIHY